jgi:hypothetical protein
MNKKILLIFLLVIASLTGLIVLNKSKKTNEQILSSSQNSSDNPVPSPTATIVPVTPADKIEVVHFHGTQQCWSCITVGEYALKTIKEKFPEEYASGKIVYKDINGELKENQDIVVKYQARGSSLFINAIRGDKDDITEDTTVWRLVNNESQFVSYFENKLNTLLGK